MFGVTGFRPILWLAVSLGFHEYWLPAVGHQPLKSGWSGCVSHFFDSLRLFKNIEGRWNISGLSKKPEEDSKY